MKKEEIMSYIVRIEDPEDGFDETYYAETEEEAYNLGLDEIQLCSGYTAVFAIEDEDSGEQLGTYTRDGEQLW